MRETSWVSAIIFVCLNSSACSKGTCGSELLFEPPLGTSQRVRLQLVLPLRLVMALPLIL